MQKFILFFLVIAVAVALYFGYITVVSKMMRSPEPKKSSETERILDEQSQRMKTLNQDYRRLMDENRRKMEDNRRQMESLRRQFQH